MIDAIVRLLKRWGGTERFARFGRRWFHRLDEVVFTVTGGRFLISELALPVVMLITRGRRSGQPRQRPLAAIWHDGGWHVVASNFGHTHDPAWALNLRAHPRAVVQRRGRRTVVEARELSPAERDAIWPLLTEQWPPYDDYVRRAGEAGRTISVFRLEPTGPARS